MTGMQRLVEIMARLRDPDNGCPWDLEQDFRSVMPYTLEEAYEVAQAIEDGDMGELRDELGDLLFQVVFHARMAEEQGAFAFEDVVTAIADKIVRRHPHVFGDAREPDAAAQTRSWEQIKAEERAEKRDTGRVSELDGVPEALPALSRAVKLQRRAARVGFDWSDWRGVFEKVHEELEELREEADSGVDQARIEEEMGDLFFALSNLSRHLRVDPEMALRASNRKFIRRFQGLEAELASEGERPDSVSRAALESAYERAKAKDKASSGA